MRTGRILTLTMVLSLFSGLAVSEASEFSMVPEKVLIEQDDSFYVDIFLDEADYLGAYQATIEVTGGDTGSLVLDDLEIDEDRPDYVFNGLNALEVVFVPGGEMAAVMLDMNCPDITEPGFLGRAFFTASSDATGVFNIRFVNNSALNLLRDCDGIPITPLTLDQSTYIGVEVDCLEDGHCDDSNACTDDTCDDNDCVFTNDDTNTCTDGNDCTDDCCSSGTCVSTNDDTNTCTDGNPCTADSCSSGTCSSTNESSGTPCDDGVSCNGTDECDGSGTCVHSGSTCGPRFPYCCWSTSTCTVLPCT